MIRKKFNGKKRMVVLGLLVLCSLAIYGCSTMGSVIPQERRISLTDTQESTGSFKQGSLSIDYTYNITGSSMGISGNTRYMGGADSLDIRVVFLDLQGAVVERKLIYATAYRNTRGHGQKRSFDKILEIPANAVDFSFTFSAQDRNRR